MNLIKVMSFLTQVPKLTSQCRVLQPYPIEVNTTFIIVRRENQEDVKNLKVMLETGQFLHSPNLICLRRGGSPHSLSSLIYLILVILPMKKGILNLLSIQ